MWKSTAIGLGLMVPGIAAGQVELQEAACPPCDLRVTEVGSLSGPDVLGEPMAAVVFRDGRVAVAFFQASDEIWVFSPDGTGATNIARSGSGPGEVKSMSALAQLPGDTLVVSDMGNRRLSTLMPDGSHVRSQRLPPLLPRDLLLPLGSRRFLLAGMGMSEGTMQHPLHLVDDGMIVRSLGELRGEFNPGNPLQTMMSGSLGFDGGFATAPRTAYEVTFWNDDGSIEAQYSRTVEWFQPYVERQPVRPENELDPWFSGIAHLDARSLLAAVQVPTEDWRDHLGEPETSGGGELWYPDHDLSQMYETRLEVIDLESGTVIVNETLPWAATLTGDGVLVRYWESRIGEPFIRLYEVEWTR